ncbi:MAG: transglycosylase domain-containing protein [Chloroflexi bacterium]|nr:transglycosylase domain-containing protein [Chloroflexota bacterium]
MPRPTDPTPIIRRRARRRRGAAGHPGRWWVRGGVGLAALLNAVLALAVLTGVWMYAGATQDLPPTALLSALMGPQGQLRQPSRILDRTGEVVLLEYSHPGVLGAAYIPLAEIPPDLANAIVAQLDPGFHEHSGAALASWRDPEPQTLAERLADELLLYAEPPGPRRALRLRLLAAQMTAEFGRDQILEWFLNHADFGHLAFGADAAARVYFGKPLAALNLAENAMLAAIAQAPALNPQDAPALALERQGRVLRAMLAQGMITAEQAIQANANPLTLQPLQETAAPLAPEFVALALEQLSADIPSERLERGGLRVLTTLDANLQAEVACGAAVQLARLSDDLSPTSLADVDCELARLLPTLPPGPALAGRLEAQAAVLDNASGQILALVGDPAWAHTPGTSLSPFVYLTAFARGFSPASLAWDVPASLPAGLEGYGNADGDFHGPLRLRTALANDYVVPALQVLAQVGPPNTWNTATQSGLEGLDPADPGRQLLDRGELSLLALTHAYSMLGNQGLLAGRADATGRPVAGALLRVEDAHGRVLFDYTQPGQRAVTSAQLAYLVTHILSDVLARQPSLGRPNPLEPGRPAAAKLGQTANGLDTWTLGYSPQLTVGVWIGAAEGEAGGPLSPLAVAGLWHAVFRAAHASLPALSFSEPAGLSRIQVCDPSGLLPGADCPTVVEELFMPGTEPHFLDNLYQRVLVNRQTGRLATVFTPPELVESRVYLAVPPQARDWALAAGLDLPPEDYDAIFTSGSQGPVSIQSPPVFAYVRGIVSIIGQADVPDFAYYRVQIGEGLYPLQWLQIGHDHPTAVAGGELVQWDTSGLNGLYAVQLLVIDSQNVVQTATIQVTVDNLPPSVQILYPAEEQTFQYPGERNLTFQAQVDDGIALASVEFLVDGRLLIRLASAPFAAAWQGTAGEHTLTVRATDLAGNTTTQSVTFTLLP